MLAKLAFLSALARPRRAVLIILVVAVSVFVMDFVSGWANGMRQRAEKKVLQETAQVLVEPAARIDALDPLAPTGYIEDAAALSAEIASDPRVLRAEAMIPFSGLIKRGDKSLGVVVYGVPPGTGFFAQVSRGAVQGTFPPRGNGLAISERALRLIGADGASTVSVIAYGASGTPSRIEMPVSCVFATDDGDFDQATAFVDSDAASALLGTRGAPELWIRLKDANAAAAFSAGIAPRLAQRGLRARTWTELQGNLLVMVKFMDLFILVINAFVLAVAATVITNAILMNVFDKQREYGTLRALGMKRRGQTALILIEGAVQGGAGALIGSLAALPAVLFLAARGLPIGAASNALGGGDVMYFGFDPASAAGNLIFGTLIAVVGSLYAAAASRGRIIDALRAL